MAEMKRLLENILADLDAVRGEREESLGEWPAFTAEQWGEVSGLEWLEDGSVVFVDDDDDGDG